MPPRSRAIFVLPRQVRGNCRLERKSELARVVLFFAADDSGIRTNQNYVDDGGWV